MGFLCFVGVFRRDVEQISGCEIEQPTENTGFPTENTERCFCRFYGSFPAGDGWEKVFLAVFS